MYVGTYVRSLLLPPFLLQYGVEHALLSSEEIDKPSVDSRAAIGNTCSTDDYQPVQLAILTQD